ncbi:hypothetical protein Droror1_Dr00010661 [Drosera rotundifolia]
MGSLHIDNIGNVDHVSKAKTNTVVSGDSSRSHISDSLSTGAERVESSSSAPDYGSFKNSNGETNGDAKSPRKMTKHMLCTYKGQDLSLINYISIQLLELVS